MPNAPRNNLRDEPHTPRSPEVNPDPARPAWSPSFWFEKMDGACAILAGRLQPCTPILAFPLKGGRDVTWSRRGFLGVCALPTLLVRGLTLSKCHSG